MAPRIALRGLAKLPAQPCPGCAARLTARSLIGGYGARGISTSYLEKVKEGEQRWMERADKIQNGEVSHAWDVLAERGFIKDVAGFVPPLTRASLREWPV